MDPIVKSLSQEEEILWINPHKSQTIPNMAPTLEDIQEADQRLRRFGPFFKAAFADVSTEDGLIESPIHDISGFQNAIVSFVGGRILGEWFLKRDDLLPISGSIKARGGVYEIIALAESLALKAGLINDLNADYSCFKEAPFQALFSNHTIVVGSTGNLGLSIGTISRALGFKVICHMSHDAKPWKIERLKSLGVNVVLHASDYSVAVAHGREMADADPCAYFIDDEHSSLLFTGYAVAALRLKEQLPFEVSEQKPLFVYLPCGVGGAPGGIAYGLKLIFGPHVYLFFAEPTQSPCMLLGLHTGKNHDISVNDIGLNNRTIADGLAVGRASGFVGDILKPILDGAYTVSDEKLLWMLYMLKLSCDIALEPSALAGLIGPVKLFYTAEGFEHMAQNGLLEKMENAVHLSWATGGSMVPKDISEADIKKGQAVGLSCL